jgi:hypothetical protein
MKKYKSMFSSMFSGKFEVVKDANGRFFLDRDPEGEDKQPDTV